MKDLLKKNVVEIRDDLVESYENGTLIDYLSERVLEVKRNELNNELEYLLFTMGGPHIELDMGVERNGVICGYESSNRAYASIPRFTIWEKMKLEIVEIFETAGGQ